MYDFEGDVFNDVLCDSRGRVYCGMLAPNFFDRPNRGKHGSFWLFENGKMTCLDREISPTPDGIAMDAAGNLWVTHCRPNGALLCYNPEGKIIRRVHVPANRTMSVAFGGADGKTVFVTTGCAGTGQVGFDGGVFAFRANTPGAAEYLFPLS